MGTRPAATGCAEACASAVDLLHQEAGGSAIQESGRIARCFREIHAATQRLGIAHGNHELRVRVLFGLDRGTSRF